MALTKVTHDVLEDRYTAASAVTSATTITIDSSSADIFTWTAGHSATINFTNVKIGILKIIYNRLMIFNYQLLFFNYQLYMIFCSFYS